MARKSSITKLAPQVRKRLEKHLRDDRLTLSEIVEDLREAFPDELLPSRTAVWRHKDKFQEMMRRAREQQEMASVLVAELGENPDEKAGALMVQSITTLATHASMLAQANDAVAIDDVRKLARAAKDVIQARKVDRQEREAIRAAARKEALEDAAQEAESTAKQQGLSNASVAALRQAIMSKL